MTETTPPPAAVQSRLRGRPVSPETLKKIENVKTLLAANPTMPHKEAANKAKILWDSLRKHPLFKGPGGIKEIYPRQSRYAKDVFRKEIGLRSIHWEKRRSKKGGFVKDRYLFRYPHPIHYYERTNRDSRNYIVLRTVICANDAESKIIEADLRKLLKGEAQTKETHREAIRLFDHPNDQLPGRAGRAFWTETGGRRKPFTVHMRDPKTKKVHTKNYAMKEEAEQIIEKLNTGKMSLAEFKKLARAGHPPPSKCHIRNVSGWWYAKFFDPSTGKTEKDKPLRTNDEEVARERAKQIDRLGAFLKANPQTTEFIAEIKRDSHSKAGLNESAAKFNKKAKTIDGPIIDAWGILIFFGARPGRGTGLKKAKSMELEASLEDSEQPIVTASQPLAPAEPIQKTMTLREAFEYLKSKSEPGLPPTLNAFNTRMFDRGIKPKIPGRPGGRPGENAARYLLSDIRGALPYKW